MGKIWIIMLISSIGALLFTNPAAALTAMLEGSTNALNLSLKLVAMYGFWLGFFAIIEKLGVSEFLAKLLRPLMRFLFKGSSKEAQKYITLNMSANLIGLGNAATPMGISAIKALDDGSAGCGKGGRLRANTNMIMLVVISATSLQLLPSTVIGMRAANGSAFPSSFLLPCMIATTFSTIIGIVLVKICSKLFPDVKRVKIKNGRENRIKALPAAALPIALHK